MGRVNLEILQQERQAVTNLFKKLQLEEVVLRQKAWIQQWLSLGDQNKQYFHEAIKCKQTRNAIISITLENGGTARNAGGY